MKIEVIVGLSATVCALLVLRTILEDILKVRCIDCGSRSRRWNMTTFYSKASYGTKFYACRGYCSRKMIKQEYQEVQPSD